MLHADLGRHSRRPSEVSSGPREVRYESARDRITDRDKNNRDRLSRISGCLRGWRSQRYDDVDLEAHQLGGQLGQLSESAFGPSVLEIDVPSLRVAEVAKASSEPIQCGGGGSPQEPEPWHLPPLLRLGRERRGEEAATDHSNKRSSVHHSIT